jgi:NAD(P)-dependent dehydrogenase (short-subunit alcohol dehydrogenase family)
VKGKSTNGWPGTIDDTAEEIQTCGGVGIAIQCDHTDDEQTKAAIEKVRREQGRLDILVNNVWGMHDLSLENKPLWELPLGHWDTMFTGGVRAQLATNRYAIPLMRENKQGLIVHTTFWDENKYTGAFYYDLAKNALNRMAYGLSFELRPDHIAVLAVSPGFMRTELVLLHNGIDEEHWREAAGLERTETPHYVGRAITSLACDANVMEKTGKVFRAGDLAQEYGFTDIDGRKVPPFQVS